MWKDDNDVGEKDELETGRLVLTVRKKQKRQGGVRKKRDDMNSKDVREGIR